MGQRMRHHSLRLPLILLVQICVGMSSAPVVNDFFGKYYVNNDRSMNFVVAAPFESEEEKIRMLALFDRIQERKPRSNALFVHDTLYNIEFSEDPHGRPLMHCWTGDMQLTVNGEVSSNQAKGKTIITLDRSTGLASMDIGGGWGREKWVLRLDDRGIEL